MSCCPREEVGQHIGSTDLAVPLMARLDSHMLARAPRLKAILQYGVGVEGIDIPAVLFAAIAPILNTCNWKLFASFKHLLSLRSGCLCMGSVDWQHAGVYKSV